MAYGKLPVSGDQSNRSVSFPRSERSPAPGGRSRKLASPLPRRRPSEVIRTPAPYRRRQVRRRRPGQGDLNSRCPAIRAPEEADADITLCPSGPLPAADQIARPYETFRKRDRARTDQFPTPPPGRAPRAAVSRPGRDVRETATQYTGNIDIYRTNSPAPDRTHPQIRGPRHAQAAAARRLAGISPEPFFRAATMTGKPPTYPDIKRVSAQ
jgi:hypothetical protein